MTFDLQTSLASPSGANLNLYVKSAAASGKGVVQINHGLAEHAARYARFAEYLAGRGFHTYAHDHRGHGYTKAPDAPRGVFARSGGAGKVIADIAAVHERIAEHHPGLPVVVFGHSLGGLIAINFLFSHPQRVQAAAIFNANFSIGFGSRLAQAILAWERFRLGSDVPSRALPRLTFQEWAKKVQDRRTEFDWLSRDAAEVDKYISDPLCGWEASVSMWSDVFRFIVGGANDVNFSPVRKDLPILLAGGQKDPMTSGGRAVLDLADRMQRMGFSNLQSKVYAETRHESLNEVNRDVIMADFAQWAATAISSG
jgi:alpha-beta hydrolase superfamily lysophospholipase